MIKIFSRSSLRRVIPTVYGKELQAVNVTFSTVVLSAFGQAGVLSAFAVALVSFYQTF
jgi:hypothetical protein